MDKEQLNRNLFQLIASVKTPEDCKMLFAKIYLKTGETEKAKEALTFIKEKGNRLYAVTVAEKMLAEI